MAQITLKGNLVNTNGELPAIGSKAPQFTLTTSGLAASSLADYAGKKVILNIFPSIDTGTCATSVRTFNSKASALENTVVLCISADLPFAHGRFCGAENITNVSTLSTFKSNFAADYGLKIIDGPLEGLCARSIVVLDENGTVKYTELVAETVDEPNYDLALKNL